MSLITDYDVPKFGTIVWCSVTFPWHFLFYDSSDLILGYLSVYLVCKIEMVIKIL